MIFVDTNILIRLLTDDIPALRMRAEKLIQENSSQTLTIPDVVLSEVFFVLEKSKQYNLDRVDVCARLNDLLDASPFVISQDAYKALAQAAKPPKLDFTDCLLAVYADGKGANLLTFDQGLQKILHA